MYSILEKVIFMFQVLLKYILMGSNYIGYFVDKIHNVILKTFPSLKTLDSYFMKEINSINNVFNGYITYTNIIAFFVVGISLYILCKKAGYRDNWFAFIPLLNLILLLDLVNINAFAIVLLLNPILRGILIIIFMYKYVKIISYKYHFVLFVISILIPQCFAVLFIVHAFKDYILLLNNKIKLKTNKNITPIKTL